jgi:hypothetical protein
MPRRRREASPGRGNVAARRYERTRGSSIVARLGLAGELGLVAHIIVAYAMMPIQTKEEALRCSSSQGGGQRGWCAAGTV